MAPWIQIQTSGICSLLIRFLRNFSFSSTFHLFFSSCLLLFRLTLTHSLRSPLCFVPDISSINVTFRNSDTTQVEKIGFHGRAENTHSKINTMGDVIRYIPIFLQKTSECSILWAKVHFCNSALLFFSFKLWNPFKNIKEQPITSFFQLYSDLRWLYGDETQRRSQRVGES